MRYSLFAAASAALIAAVLAWGCGGDDGQSSSSATTSTGGGDGGQGGTTSTGVAGGGGTGGQGGDGGAGGGPPIACDVTPTTGIVLAADRYLLGETNPDGTPNAPNGWRQYGFNIDGLVSTAQSQDLCQPQNGAAPSTVYPDGDNGIDNAFGKHVLPLLLSLTLNASAEATEGIHDGKPTVLLHLADLLPGPDQNQIPAAVYLGSEAPAPPVFDGTDCWPVDPVSLLDPMEIASSTVSFPQSLLQNNAWASGAVSPGPLTLRFNIAGYPLTLKIRHVRMTLDLAAGHDSAVNGQLGGVLDTEEFVEAIHKLVGAFDPILCEGSTLEGILQQMRQASDILQDGTQSTGVTCNAISIGIGFTMARVNLGSIAPPTPDMNPCPPP
jgi:hypothetical protein